mmetsp:Transcript_15557/g.24185  ORF Transcript_15557/g.24185 Transcript_15557/m.24185 type:complete len:148 (-) Transcript_15557:602-1045(-)|eukprot:CAMPEP_0196804782 /NCGR_PEP_ID=MMETSP1362-20130617/4446_1 /TAXON_ID=163516 /ORGANISM="Leptocylindrus danicus, Strain CCMP1856" /LENGTH=147 /DNA_ID=CAMNT_0042177283 /DNA_START=120 /DNA_END=563 /DNA_ORIENTATION=+
MGCAASSANNAVVQHHDQQHNGPIKTYNSSTFHSTSTNSNKSKPKKSLYPGQRRAPVPEELPEAFAINPTDGNAIITHHYQTVPGGTALMRVPGPPPVQQANKLEVTVPPGVEPGQVIRVQAPDGRVNEVTVPDGMGVGSTFFVDLR